MNAVAKLALVGVACLASACGGEDEDVADAGPGATTLAFVSPVENSVLLRDHLADDGKLVASGTFELEVTGATPARIDLSLDGDAMAPVLATATGEGPHYQADVAFDREGVTFLRAVAVDDGDQELATATLRITIATAEKSCRDWLDIFGVDYTDGPALEGVPDPITATLPLGGISYRYAESTSFRTTLKADCKLIQSLAMAAPYLAERGVVSIVDLGIYNYRCIGGGQPPCPEGLSQHAMARAIDFHAFLTDDDTEYNVETDWVIDGDNEETCAASTENDKDAWLHELICDLYSRHLWNIILTPNYNADHRDHFHVDLTAGADYMRSRKGVDVVPGDRADD